MSNNAQRLIQQYLAVSGDGAIQTDRDVPLISSKLNTRDKCEISVEEIVNRQVVMDCDGRDPDDETINTRLKRFTFVYAAIRPQILARWAAYYFGSTSAPTGSQADESQTLTRSGSITAGSFTLALPLEGRTGLTAPISYTATTAQIRDALTRSSSIGKLVKDGDVAVTGDWTAGIVVAFANRLRRANLPLLVADSTGLTGGTINVAQTVQGDQKYHAFSRSTSDTKVLFSFALGYKTGGLPAEKYYNACVERFEPTLTRNGDVGLTVSVLCNYEPELVTGFSVPACANYAPLKTSDCRIQIGTDWKTLDIFSQTMQMNDSIPVDADTFGFDSVDPDTLERGDQPQNSVAGQIFGAPIDTSDNFAQSVKAESKVAYTTHFGMPGDRFSLIFPKLKVRAQSNSRQHAGARNRQVIAFDGLPTRDGAYAPVRAEAYLDQTTAFLLN